MQGKSHGNCFLSDKVVISAGNNGIFPRDCIISLKKNSAASVQGFTIYEPTSAEPDSSQDVPIIL